MDKRRLFLIIGLLFFAGILFTLVQRLGAPAPTVAAVAPETIVEKVEYDKILVASNDLSVGARVSASSVVWKQWPVEALTPSLISKKERPDAIEQMDRSIVRSAILAGEPMSENKLVKAGASGVMAALLKPGMRAVTTRISVDTAAGGFIQPGDKVDIILTQSLQASNVNGLNQNERIYTADTIFENVHVLAIDQTYSSTSAQGGATVIGSTATFEMSQQDSELLQEAVSKGDLSLTLRGINRSGARAVSTAKTEKKQIETQSSLTVYRGGQPKQVAIRGQ